MRVPGSGRVRRFVRQVRGRFAARGLILMYHRVAYLDCDRWGLAVSPAHFAEHVDVLRSRQSAIPLSHLAQELRRGDAGGRRPIVITFDDGYADNIDSAKPLLEQSGIPA